MANERKEHTKFVLDMTYPEPLPSEDRAPFEDKLFPLLDTLGFTVVAGSRLGVSVSAARETIENTFQAEIVMTVERVKGGTFGPDTVTRTTFSRPPVIPPALAPYVKRVQFSPPAIPLT